MTAHHLNKDFHFKLQDNLGKTQVLSTFSTIHLKSSNHTRHYSSTELHQYGNADPLL